MTPVISSRTHPLDPTGMSIHRVIQWMSALSASRSAAVVCGVDSGMAIWLLAKVEKPSAEIAYLSNFCVDHTSSTVAIAEVSCSATTKSRDPGLR